MRIPVGILGATGVIGQHYVSLLQNHPWFEITCLAASKPAQSYEEAVRGRWQQTRPIPKGYTLSSIENFSPCPILFSALPNELAAQIEPRLAREGCWVISSASCHRENSPVIIPEINPHHISGNRLIAKPNCAIQSFLLPLAPLHKIAGIRSLSVTTLQSISGAGNSGLASSAIHDNVIPYIEGEEEKIESEPLKILEAIFPISAHCNRIPVLHGHLACISVSFNKMIKREEILSAWSQPSALTLPSAPKYPIVYHDAPERPQSRLDRDADGGMSVAVGRLRPCSLFDWRFAALSHNAVRGGAGGGILIAEYLKQGGYLDQT
ncbi:MAG: aspartate-semialdehyde dehydrogenase [Chlamydiales bacterium]|nr:aspartate-semialdehyde dehydrogenase [Chlamydiales bacterium]